VLTKRLLFSCASSQGTVYLGLYLFHMPSNLNKKKWIDNFFKKYLRTLREQRPFRSFYKRDHKTKAPCHSLRWSKTNNVCMNTGFCHSPSPAAFNAANCEPRHAQAPTINIEMPCALVSAIYFALYYSISHSLRRTNYLVKHILSISAYIDKYVDECKIF
jgi:hypothetical protein